MNMFKSCCLVLSLMGLMMASADASVLYSDDFSGASGDWLADTTPDTTIGTNTWLAQSVTGSWKADGSIATTGVNLNQNALLAFTPEKGRVYTLSVDMDVTSDSSWFGFGFFGSDSLTISLTSDSMQASPWMYMQWDRARAGTYVGPGINGVQNKYPTGGQDWSGSVTMTIVLDTTAVDWSIEWLINGISQRTHTYTNGYPSISYVGFSRQAQATGTVDNFELSVSPDSYEATVYADDFSGAGEDYLAGTVPDTTVGTNQWIARTETYSWMADGSIAVPAANQNENALLAFTPETGMVYTLSVDMDVVGDDYTWMAMGFLSTNSLAGSMTSTSTEASPWMYMQANGGKAGTYVGPGSNGLENKYPTGGQNWAGVNTMTIMLYTTKEQWGVEWLINGVSQRTYSYTNGNPAISYIGIARQAIATGTIENLELTGFGYSTPEVGVIAIAPAADGMVFSWGSSVGASYILQEKTNLVADAVWVNVMTNIIGTGTDLSVTAAVDQAQAFYRIVSE